MSIAADEPATPVREQEMLVSTAWEATLEERERILRGLEYALTLDPVGTPDWVFGYEKAIDDAVAIVRGEA